MAADFLWTILTDVFVFVITGLLGIPITLLGEALGIG